VDVYGCGCVWMCMDAYGCGWMCFDVYGVDLCVRMYEFVLMCMWIIIIMCGCKWVWMCVDVC